MSDVSQTETDKRRLVVVAELDDLGVVRSITVDGVPIEPGETVTISGGRAIQATKDQ